MEIDSLDARLAAALGHWPAAAVEAAPGPARALATPPPEPIGSRSDGAAPADELDARLAAALAARERVARAEPAVPSAPSAPLSPAPTRAPQTSSRAARLAPAIAALVVGGAAAMLLAVSLIEAQAGERIAASLERDLASSPWRMKWANLHVSLLRRTVEIDDIHIIEATGAPAAAAPPIAQVAHAHATLGLAALLGREPVVEELVLEGARVELSSDLASVLSSTAPSPAPAPAPPASPPHAEDVPRSPLLVRRLVFTGLEVALRDASGPKGTLRLERGEVVNLSARPDELDAPCELHLAGALLDHAGACLGRATWDGSLAFAEGGFERGVSNVVLSDGAGARLGAGSLEVRVPPGQARKLAVMGALVDGKAAPIGRLDVEAALEGTAPRIDAVSVTGTLAGSEGHTGGVHGRVAATPAWGVAAAKRKLDIALGYDSSQGTTKNEASVSLSLDDDESQGGLLGAAGREGLERLRGFLK